MSLQITSTIYDDHLRVDFDGDYDFLELMSLIEKIKDEATATEREIVLIDARKIDGRMTESEKFFAGAKIAELYGSKLKTAIIIRTGEVTKMGEMAAVNRGARLLVTESEEEAVDWLFSSIQGNTP